MVSMVMRALCVSMLMTAGDASGDDDDKSTALGVSLSSGATAAGVVLMWTEETPGIVSGATLFLAGPSLGHWYAHDGVNAGMGLRALGAAIALVGCLSACGYEADDDAGAAAILWTGVGVYALGTVYEIATVPRAVRAYNQRHDAYTVSPVVRADGAGLVVGGTW